MTVDSSQTRLAHIAESTWGTTPATPTFVNLRYTSESLNANIENVVSNEIRADRNVADLIQVGQSAGGNVNFELSAGTFDTLIESLMYSTWSSNVIKNGVTQKSVTLEKTFEGGATDQYHRFAGAIVNTMSLSMQVGQIVTGSFGFVAKNVTQATSAIAGSGYTAVNTNPVMNAAAGFGSLAITGSTGPELTSLNINISNNLRVQQAIGSVAARGVTAGRFVVTGDLTAYFESAELYALFLAGTAADLTFALTDAGSKSYTFVIGNLKFSNCEIVAGGNDQDVMVKMNFQGLFETDNTLQITRVP